jgi:iron complex transport system substrate-binding protein
MRISGLALIAAAWLFGCAAAPAAPRRIVSLNPCIDSIVLRLVEPDRIVAVSRYSHDPEGSLDAGMARRFPAAGETAEEIVRLKGDLVLTTRHMSPATRFALLRLKTPLVELDVPADVDESYAQIRQIGRLTRREAAAEALVAAIKRALDRARPAPGTPALPVMILHSNGFSPGRGTLPDDLLRRTGFINRAAPLGKGWGKVTLEQFVANPPALLILSSGTAGQARAMQHPVMRAAARVRRATITPKLLYCAGPAIAPAAEALAAIRRSHGA